MPAKNHINPKQMRLFIPASELMETLAGDSSINNGTLSTDTNLSKLKLDEAKIGRESGAIFPKAKPADISFHESIKKHGVIKPVLIEGDTEEILTLHNGHHRVVAANDIDPDMLIPVTYASTPGGNWEEWEETNGEITPKMRKGPKPKGN